MSDKLQKSIERQIKNNKSVEKKVKNVKRKGGKLASGQYIPTRDDARKYAEEFISMLKYHMGAILTGSVLGARSVYNLCENLAASNLREVGDGVYKIDVSFERRGMLEYPSFYNEDNDGNIHYTGGGIQNIIALFNNGVSAGANQKPVSGIWNHDGEDKFGSAFYRPGLDFIKNSVDEFNGLFRHEDIPATAEYSSEYDGGTLQ